MDAELRLDHSLVALETDGGVFGLVELRAPEPPAGVGRPKLAIALVIDRSGSMAGEKLAVAKSCARFLAGRITSEDRLGVIAFDDHVSLVAALQGPGSVLVNSIDHIHEGGSTNLSGGWLKGVELLDGQSAEVRRVLLLSDGQANVGIKDHPQLSAMSAGAAGRGITTTTIGFGEGFDEDLLSAMADSGRGRDHFAASPDEAPAIFAQEFEGLATMVAQNVSIEIRPAGPAYSVAILHEYPTTAVETGVQATLGDLFGGEVRKLIFRVQAPAMAELGQVKVAEVVIRWTDITGQVEMHTRTVPVMVNVVPVADAAGEEADSKVTEEIVVLNAAKALKEARNLADKGDYQQAQMLLADQAVHLSSISPDSELFQIANDDIEELGKFGRRLEEGTYDRADSKGFLDHSRRRQRSEDIRKRPERT